MLAPGRAADVDGEDVLFPIDVRENAASAEIVGGVNFTQLTKEVRTKTTQTMTDNGFAVIYSASKGQKAADGPPGGNSPFMQQFLNALAYQGDELSDPFRRIGQEMAHTTPGQTPFFEDARKVEFYFNKPDDDPRDGVIKILVFNSCRAIPSTKPLSQSSFGGDGAGALRNHSATDVRNRSIALLSDADASDDKQAPLRARRRRMPVGSSMRDYGGATEGDG